MRVIPDISTANPSIIVPTSCLRLSLDIMTSMIPTRANIGAKFSGLRRFTRILSLSIPATESIHAVSVVPMFEPIMTPIVCPSFIIPEFTRPTSMTVIAEEDWIAIVIPAPRARAVNLLSVARLSIFSSLLPDIFSSPEDITCIPYRKNANPPSKVITEKTVII